MRASEAWVDDAFLWVRLEDGRQVGSPLAQFGRLAQASPEQLRNFRLIGRGVSIHWPDLDEDISVEGLLRS